MQTRTFVLAPRSAAGRVALLTVVVALGAVVVVFGLALLLALAAAGTVAAVATLAWRRLTGRAHRLVPPERAATLDPRMEIRSGAAPVHAEWAEEVGVRSLPRATDE